jgi:hypothetical protein
VGQDSTRSTSSFAAVVEWVLKLWPLTGAAILFVVTLYINQSSMLKTNESFEKRLTAIETQKNLDDRELVKRLASMDSDITEVKHDLQFYIQTRGK